MEKKIIIAIDGHSSCGKSTMAKQLAKQIGYVYVDTGAMYRAVTLFAMQNGMYPDEGIREEELKTAVSNGEIQISFEVPQGTTAYVVEGRKRTPFQSGKHTVTIKE